MQTKAKEKQTVTIGLRVSETFYNKLESCLPKTNCRSVTELTRRILYKEEIIWYHKNTELESVAIELSLIRRELNSIGRNINQITHHFHIADLPNQKIIQASRVVAEYKKVGVRVDDLQKTITDISKKWLPK